MNLSTDLVLDDASGDDVTYRRVAMLPNGSDWIDVSTDLREPGRLKILHSVNGKNDDAIDRHLVQLVRTKIDASGIPRTATLNVTLSVPRSSIITNQIVFDMVGNMLDFVCNAGLTTPLADTTVIAQLLRGES